MVGPVPADCRGRKQAPLPVGSDRRGRDHAGRASGRSDFDAISSPRGNRGGALSPSLNRNVREGQVRDGRRCAIYSTIANASLTGVTRTCLRCARRYPDPTHAS
jgi:hypothetical protein